jgi:hypothetical protein
MSGFLGVVATVRAATPVLQVYQPALVGVLGALLVLVLPGFALTSSVLHGQLRGVSERLVFSLGVSLAMAMLAGFVLNWTSWGLQAPGWVLLLGDVTLALAAWGLARLRWAIYRQPASRAVSRGTRVAGGWRFRDGLLFGIGATLVISALLVARHGALAQTGPGFTQLWMVPEPASDGQNSVQIGFSNDEQGPTRYDLQLTVDDQLVTEWPSITLDPGGRWTEVVALPSQQYNQVEARLLQEDSPQEQPQSVVLRGALGNPEASSGGSGD